MSLLFANTTRGGGQSGALIDLKAGRCVIEQGSSPNARKVIPQPQKGTVFLKLTNDQLLHFCWKNRDSGETQLDLIVFPGDTEFIRMKEPTDGRVYMLKLKSSSDRHIFWMQEPKADKDDELCKRVNELLNNPTSASRNSAFRTPGSTATAGAPAGGSPSAAQLAALRNLGLPGADEMGALSSMDQNQLLQLLTLMGEGGGSGSPISALTFAGTQGKKQGSGTKMTTGSGAGATSAQGSSANAGMPKKSMVDAQTLSKIISSLPASSSSHPAVDLPSILSRANVQESVAANASSLLPYVPNQEPMSSAEKELGETVGNPQFRQAAEFFGAALQTGKLSDALPHFRIKDGAVKAAQKGDFLEFAKELSQKEKSGQPAASADEKKSLDEEGAIHETNESAIKKKDEGRDGGASGDGKKRGGGATDNMDLD